MDFKKRNYFTPKKEDSTFSKRKKSISINKELFPGKFVCLWWRPSLAIILKYVAALQMAMLIFTSSEATNAELCFPKTGSHTQIHCVIDLIKTVSL